MNYTNGHYFYDKDQDASFYSAEEGDTVKSVCESTNSPKNTDDEVWSDGYYGRLFGLHSKSENESQFVRDTEEPFGGSTEKEAADFIHVQDSQDGQFLAGHGLDVSWLVELNLNPSEIEPCQEDSKPIRGKRGRRRRKNIQTYGDVSDALSTSFLRRSTRIKEKASADLNPEHLKPPVFSNLQSDHVTKDSEAPDEKQCLNFHHHDPQQVGLSSKSLGAKPELTNEADPRVKENIRKPLKICFKRCARANPIDKKLLGYQEFRKGLLDSSKELATELYLIRSGEPRTVSCDDLFLPTEIQVRADNYHIKTALKFRWMTYSNLAAVARTHGRESLGKMKKKVTPDGNVKGVLNPVNLDPLYEELVSQQSHLQIAQEMKRDPGNAELNADFNNLTCFDEAAEDQHKEGEEQRSKTKINNWTNNVVIGAVKINESKYDRSTVFKGEKISFAHQGQCYRLNPAVVIVEKMSDDLIEKVMAKPVKPSLATFGNDMFYNFVCSYMEKEPQAFSNNNRDC